MMTPALSLVGEIILAAEVSYRPVPHPKFGDASTPRTFKDTNTEL